jgi:hypothetical protein
MMPLQRELSALVAVLVVIVLGCTVCRFAVRTGVAPAFYWPITPDGQHFLVVQNGPNGPYCTAVLPLVNGRCHVPGQHQFAIYYRTPGEFRLLVLFEWQESITISVGDWLNGHATLESIHR